MDINKNPSTSNDPKIYVMNQSGKIYYFFKSQIATSDERYTLISWRATAGWKNPARHEVKLSPPSRKNLNKLILEMRKISKFPWDCFHPPPRKPYWRFHNRNINLGGPNKTIKYVRDPDM